MNQPIRQAQGEKGFALLIIIIITTLAIGAGVGGFLVFQEFQEKKMPSFEKTAQQTEDITSPMEPTLSPVQSVRSPSPKPRQSVVEPPLSFPSLTPKPLGSPQVKVGEKDNPPILKNLGINIEPWNKQTNLAGDLIFTNKVLFTDTNIKNEKVFTEFGEFEHVINNPDRSVEYWFFLQPGTKIRAAADGVVSVGFIEHSKDWGINISPRDGSKWFVGHEHLINLVVKEGDVIKAGDIIGDAMLHKSFGADLGFTELAVWTGDRDGIVKYCPFSFLEDSLKPAYEEKLKRIAKDWEEFIGKDVYKQEEWVAPGCLLDKIQER